MRKCGYPITSVSSQHVNLSFTSIVLDNAFVETNRRDSKSDVEELSASF